MEKLDKVAEFIFTGTALNFDEANPEEIYDYLEVWEIMFDTVTKDNERLNKLAFNSLATLYAEYSIVKYDPEIYCSEDWREACQKPLKKMLELCLNALNTTNLLRKDWQRLGINLMDEVDDLTDIDDSTLALLDNYYD